MKRIKKALAVLLSAGLLLGLFAGCSSKDPVVATVLGLDITASEYRYYLNLQRSSYIEATGLTYDQIGNVAMDEEGTTVEEFSRQTALNLCAVNRVLDWKFDDLGLKLTDEDNNTVETQIASLKSYYGSESNFKKMLKTNNLTEQAFRNVLMASVKSQRIANYLYDVDGPQEISEDEMREYFNDQFVRVKQIAIKTVNDAGGALDEETMKAQEQLCYDTIDRIQKNGEDFETVMSEVSEDTEMKDDPDGYIFDINAEYDEQFMELAFGLKEGYVGMAQTSWGYSIIKKYPLDDEKYFEDNRDYVLTMMKGKRIDELVGQLVVDNQPVVDEAALEEASKLPSELAKANS
ncbi:SurA N-terminal domain-containing protein [Feifania hominis]|uniref:SurA N-terminal domain-containing protein n=1 Tax=Feifania hominis TaxID=2763660 RepID=A0A926DF32_9FIRM|nr:SurA N-terminal domain-containing protein [Feifania hominis]MBC8536634.1 SurA N-terminal domain-containing protein [Feifania hominis]